MKLEALLFDYIWKWLFLMSVATPIYLAVILFGARLIKNRSSYLNTKWYFNIQIALLFFVLVVSLFFTWAGDPELVTRCFDQFAKTSQSATITRSIAWLWLVGCANLIVFDLIKILISKRSLRLAREIEDRALVDILTKLKLKMGVTRPVLMKTIENHSSPFVTGFIHHTIVLPREICEQTDTGVITSILAHELIHIRDYDSFWRVLELFCRRFLFWNPLIYQVNRLYRVVVENAADEQAVMKSGIEPHEFLRALVDVVSFIKVKQSSPMQLNISRDYKETRLRIEALGQFSKPKENLWGGVIFVAVTVMALVVSIGEAGAMTGRLRKPSDGLMCSQVAHERAIESWLLIEPEPNTCEK